MADEMKGFADRHNEFKQKAASAGAAYEDSYFEPGVKASESGKDYVTTAADQTKGVFEGRGYSESDAQDLDSKFEQFANDAAEMKAHQDMAGGKDMSPEDGKEEK